MPDLAQYDTGMGSMIVEIVETDKEIYPNGNEEADPIDVVVIRKIGGDGGTMTVRPEDVTPVNMTPEDVPATWLDRVDDQRPYESNLVDELADSTVSDVVEMERSQLVGPASSDDVNAIIASANRVIEAGE